jgi:hypothetical protein
MKLLSIFALAGALAVSGSAFAASQTTTPAAPAATTTTTAPAMTTTKPAMATTKPAMTGKMDKTAISKKCSADADAKGLHGKDRKKFRDSCKTQAMKQG